jgi:hypothetical protein
MKSEEKLLRKSHSKLINIESDDKVKAFICTQDLKDQDYIKSHNLIMVTKKKEEENILREIF